MSKLIKLLFTLCLGLTFSYQVSAFDINANTKFYVFGDSLSDTGFQNLLPNTQGWPAGKQPTFTNVGGHIWPYYFKKFADISQNLAPNNGYNDAACAGIGATTNCSLNAGNIYAAGGATSSGQGVGQPGTYSPPNTQRQIALYLSQHDDKADPNALYFIWVGANNFFELLLTHPNPTPEQVEATINTTVEDIITQVETLLEKGAKHIVVIDLPNLGVTPLGYGQSDGGRVLQTLSQSFDATLQATVLNDYQEKKVISIDMGALLTQFASTPPGTISYKGKSFTFVNMKQPACQNLSLTVTALNCSNLADDASHYIFIDTVHPSDQAHQFIAWDFINIIRSIDF